MTLAQLTSCQPAGFPSQLLKIQRMKLDLIFLLINERSYQLVGEERPNTEIHHRLPPEDVVTVDLYIQTSADVTGEQNIILHINHNYPPLHQLVKQNKSCLHRVISEYCSSLAAARPHRSALLSSRSVLGVHVAVVARHLRDGLQLRLRLRLQQRLLLLRVLLHAAGGIPLAQALGVGGVKLLDSVAAAVQPAG